MSGRRADAEARGFMAAAKGQDIEMCPHEEGDERRAPWLWGWVRGKASGAFVVTVRPPTEEDYASLEDADA